MAKDLHCRILEVEGLDEAINADKDANQRLVVEGARANLDTSILKLQRMLTKKCIAKNVHCRSLEVDGLRVTLYSNANKEVIKLLLWK